ncbi:ABC transporter ATP-binding protein [Ramlibacter henchirensis]|uniref:ABC transporter ATP-binding protein n=1 Tax=Ramlibacter henchirensis TaxID=204072 RepID=A0A4Z0BW42_9BURK|nr:ABC transporter ATP-binding protein [Ramlibacter henchirensis]TFZ02580.1 ABC transporter ATP-binding protein [Ramlibacter henchirensis]
MAEALLKVDSLVSGYGDITVLHGVGFEMAPAETLCLVGSNGAGKTTLLRTLSGLLDVRGGSVRFDGNDITRWGPRQILAAGIAHVPEGRRLFGPMSVIDNLRMGAYLRHDTAEIERDIERMTAMFPILARRANQQAGTLSGGEQQMCAIARGMMGRPKLLMIDELSLGLAPQVVEQLGGVIAQVAREGVAVLLVEQDVTTAFELASKGVVLDTGRVSLQGPTAELSRNPAVRQAYMGLA